jgi:hypothetical protein
MGNQGAENVLMTDKQCCRSCLVVCVKTDATEKEKLSLGDGGMTKVRL